MVDFVDMNVLWDIDTLGGRHTVWKSDSGETDSQTSKHPAHLSDSPESAKHESMHRLHGQRIRLFI